MQIARDSYLQQLIRKQNNKLVKVITGIRRCGKSYLLFNLFKEHLLKSGVMADHIITIAFDSFENKHLQDPYALFPYLTNLFKDQEQYYVLLDEVQLLGDFESVLNSLIRRDNVDVYVTGSNAKFLSKDVITEFRGRGDEIHLNPLSFREFMTVYRGSKQDGFEDYCLYGGLPFVQSITDANDKAQFLKSIFTETYLTDIIGRHNVRNQEELSELLNVVASNIGALTNPNKLADTFKSVKHKTISPYTIKNYLEYFCDSFLIDKAQRFDIRGKRYIDSPLKYYFTDLGIRNAQLNFRQIEATHSMENVIFNELKIRQFNVDVGVVNVNTQNEQGNTVKKQLEIDFVCNQGSKRYYIQSAYALPTLEKREQEVRSLKYTGDFFKRIVISKDTTTPYYNDDGILFMNIYDFLLDDKSLEF